MTDAPLKLLVVAGEVSGDQHAEALLAALEKKGLRVEAFGLGGDGCARRGVRLVAHQKELAVVGLVEALSKIRFAHRLIRRLADEAVREKVDGAVLIDSPDFNLPLARRLSKAGIPVVFYVSPQVWAWRARRARKIARRGRAVLVLFGFEKRWWDERGLGASVTWVGHPLVDKALEELATPYPPPPAGRRRIVLMPGSRSGEIERNLPVMREAVRLVSAAHPEVDVVLVKAESVSDALLAGVAGADLARWNLVSGPHLALLAASDVLVVASGTATVEGLLARVPMVVVYRVNGLTYALGKLLVKVKHVAMANLVSDDGSGTRAVPEFVQDEATPERIACEVAAFLDDPGKAQTARERLARGAADLGPPGAPARTAEALLQALGREA